ncbi:MAG: hypothetical protein VB140_02265 [Burkholderia sp.]
MRVNVNGFRSISATTPLHMKEDFQISRLQISDQELKLPSGGTDS